MTRNNYKGKNLKTPIENNETAAWASTEKNKQISNVHIPDEIQVLNAKDYVDSNKK
ncbi:MAG: DUF3787 domain-containing protein [Vulcanibacillus sp.]